MDLTDRIVNFKSKPTYAVQLGNGTEFEGGTFQAPGWLKCPSRGLESLDLFLPSSNDIIRLEGYDKYNFFIGASKPINSQGTLVGHMYGLGCVGGEVTSYRITIIAAKGMKYKIGDITVRRFPFGKEGMGRTATSGWKMGVK